MSDIRRGRYERIKTLAAKKCSKSVLNIKGSPMHETPSNAESRGKMYCTQSYPTL